MRNDVRTWASLPSGLKLASPFSVLNRDSHFRGQKFWRNLTRPR
jgi:hypothetical protein